MVVLTVAVVDAEFGSAKPVDGDHTPPIILSPLTSPFRFTGPPFGQIVTSGPASAKIEQVLTIKMVVLIAVLSQPLILVKVSVVVPTSSGSKVVQV